MRAYLTLGKNGDVINILPVLRAEAKKTGKTQNLVIAREFAPLVEGLDYVSPFVFPGHYSEFRKAYAFAKSHFDRVEVPQMSGDDMEFNHHHPSVFLDSWARVGYLGQWDKLPLVLPHNGKTSLSGPTIFYADHSQSSPFFQKEELYKLIQETFPTHQIMRASGMRLKNLRDFLPVMDACDMIVSVETAFLHLSAATKTPVIAMVADKPTTWHGSPWSKRFALHCRYNDFDKRKVEIVAAMNRAVNKIAMPEPEIFSTARPHGYNMTMGVVDNQRISVYRYHPDGSWKTRLAIDDGSNLTQDIVFPDECKEYSLEDARFFTFKGEPHLTYTCSRESFGRWFSIQAYGPLQRVDGKWTVAKHIVPKCLNNDFTGSNKNFVPFERDGKLYFVFGNLFKTQEQLVLQMDGDKVIQEFKSPAPGWPWGGIRGGCIVPYKGQLLRFFHSKIGNGHRHYEFRYYVGAALMQAEPPFKTQIVSSFPVMAGNEKYTPDCHHWKPGCALCFGVILDGDKILLSGGLNDCENFVLPLSIGDLHL